MISLRPWESEPAANSDSVVGQSNVITPDLEHVGPALSHLSEDGLLSGSSSRPSSSGTSSLPPLRPLQLQPLRQRRLPWTLEDAQNVDFPSDLALDPISDAASSRPPKPERPPGHPLGKRPLGVLASSSPRELVESSTAFDEISPLRKPVADNVSTLFKATADSVIRFSKPVAGGITSLPKPTSDNAVHFCKPTDSHYTFSPRLSKVTPQGLAATQDEAREAYNAIDPHVADELTKRLNALVQRCENVPLEEARGVYVVIERCHSCSLHHRLTTRHKEAQYSALAQEVIGYFQRNCQGTVLDCVEMGCHLEAHPRRLGSGLACGQEIWHHASRVGAFEIYLLTPNFALDEVGAVATFVSQGPEPSDEEGEARASWGARRPLAGGRYTATLLHSKLSSRAWPTAQQAARRLFRAMPPGVIAVQVLGPTGEPLPSFTLEAVETRPAPAAPGSGRGGQGARAAPAAREPAHMVASGAEGRCRVEGVPLRAELQLRLYHRTMRVQVVEFAVTHLRLAFVFGADIVFRLWAIEIPGGLAVWASTDDLGPNRLPENARPFEGRVETSSGAVLKVGGRVQLPWDAFKPGSVEPALAFSKLRSIHAPGYHPGDFSPQLQLFTMNQLQEQELIEVCLLAAPEVCLSVVMPGGLKPVANVRVEIVAEQQTAVTDDDGKCSVTLRQGVHTARLLHEHLTVGWVEQQLNVDAMDLQLQVPLPLTLAVWQAPLTLRRALPAHELYLSTSGCQVPQSWTPFAGPLALADGTQLSCAGGALQVSGGPAVPLDGAGPQRPGRGAPPADGLAPLPPFLLPVGAGAAAAGPATFLAVQRGGRALLGTRLGGARGPGGGGRAGAAGALLVRAETRCCGGGVAGVRLRFGREPEPQEVHTGEDGTWELPLGPGRHPLEASHPALVDGPRRYEVHLAEGGEQPEFPLLLGALVHIFCLQGEGASQCVQLTADASMVPAFASAFKGRVFGAGSRELDPEHVVPSALSFLLDAESEPTEEAEPCSSACAVSEMRLEPSLPSFEWCPIEPSPLTSRGCAAKMLFGLTRPLTIGILRPFAVAVAWHLGKRHEFRLLLEEHPTAGAAAAHVAEMLGVRREAGPPITFAADAPSRKAELYPHDRLVVGHQIRALARCELLVVFGTSSDVGVPEATVFVDSPDGQGPAQRTDSDGRCELLLPAGEHRLLVSHPTLGPRARVVPVDLQSLHSTWTVAARAQVIAYSLAEADGRGCEQSAVWLCAHAGHLHATARPVAGDLRVRPHGEGAAEWEARLDEHAVGPVWLEPEEAPAAAPRAAQAPGAAPRAPLAGLALECRAEGRLWCPEGGVAAALDGAAAWAALLAGPLRAGALKAPVTVRCHGAGGAEGAEPEALLLPADAHATAAALCGALAPRLGAAPGEVAAFAGARRLRGEEALEPSSALDLWPLAPLELAARARCCGRGVGGAEVSASPDRSGRGAAGPPECSQRTGAGGECRLVLTVGQHALSVTPPDAAGEGAGAAADGRRTLRRVRVVQGSVSREDVCVDAALYIYAQPPPDLDQSTGSEALRLNVWACARLKDVPAHARPVPGTLCANGMEAVPLGSPTDAVQPVWCDHAEHRTSDGDEPCPLLDLSVDFSSSSDQLWTSSDRACHDGPPCGYLRLLEGPMLLGCLKKSFTLRFDQKSDLRLPLDEYATMGSIAQRAAEELQCAAADVGLFRTDGDRCLEGTALCPGQVLVGSLLAPLTVRVLVPESASGTQAYGLSDAEVSVDGQAAGTTDESGECHLVARVGTRKIHVQHPSDCLGPHGREVHDVAVVYGQRNERDVLTGVRVFLFASRADPESGQDLPTPTHEDASGGDDPVSDAGKMGGTILVWICSSCDQIQGDMVPTEGCISGSGLHGREVSRTLLPAATELVLISAEDAEQEKDARCTLSTLRFSVSKHGYCWRPRSPSPLIERAQEIGGCEYLRLIACPTVVGYLDPAFPLEMPDGKQVWLPVTECQTPAQTKAFLHAETGIPAEQLALFRAQKELEDNVLLAAEDPVTAKEVSHVSLQVATGCCCAPLAGVSVSVDSVHRGVTSESGFLESLKLTVGRHSVELDSSMIGSHNPILREVVVESAPSQTFALLAEAYLYFYGTELEEDSEEEEQRQGAAEAEGEGAAAERPGLVCAWLAADPAHIPEEALPLRGRVACETFAGAEVSRALAPGQIDPLVLQLGASEGGVVARGRGAGGHGGSGPQAVAHACPVASLVLHCARRGSCWAPKEPSPLAERTTEIGGCEFARVLACPVSLGFLKPAVTVQCAAGPLLKVPLDALDSVADLRAHLANSMGLDNPDDLCLQACERSDAPVLDADLKPGAMFLCAGPGEKLVWAQELLSQAEDAELAAAESR